MSYGTLIRLQLVQWGKDEVAESGVNTRRGFHADLVGPCDGKMVGGVVFLKDVATKGILVLTERGRSWLMELG